MIIKYNGPKITTRQLDGIVWSVQTGWSQAVTDPDLLENVLTYPGDQFSPDPGDPMVIAIGEEAAVLVGLSGVSSLDILAILDNQQIADLAEAADVDAETAAGWVKAATVAHNI